MSPLETLHRGQDRPAAAGTPTAGGPARFTAKEWRAFTRGRKRWQRRALAATAAVVLAEAAGILAWSAWADAFSHPAPTEPT